MPGQRSTTAVEVMGRPHPSETHVTAENMFRKQSAKAGVSLQANFIV